MTSGKLRIMAIGAHPDDCDVKVGGTAILYARAGHQVKFVSATNGDTGHHQMGGGVLARRRFAEAQEAAETAGIEYEVLDIHNGQLLPTLENRWQIVRIIREFAPDIVITHRPNDYHPDHRYTSQIVQDSAYTITIPNVAALTPALEQNCVFAYMSDDFTKPCAFQADVTVVIDDVLDDKMRMLACHESQFFEWLPFNRSQGQVPDGHAERLSWLTERQAPRFASVAEKHRESIASFYGPERAAGARHAEAFEICEYGRRPCRGELYRLFPFFDGP